MRDTAEGISLREALDTLWRNESKQAEFASQLTEQLSADAAVLLVAWDAATVAGPRQGRLRLEGSEFEICDHDGFPIRRGAVVKRDRRGAEVLYVEGFGLAARVNGADGRPVVHPAASLLRAVQTLRDHDDSMALRPPKLRDAALEGLAAEWGVPRDPVNQWVRWMPALLEHIDG